MKRIIKYSTILTVMSFLFAGSAFAQDPVSKGDLESVLSRFTNYRYGTVSIWRFKNDDRDRFREAIKEFEMAESGQTEISNDFVNKFDKRIVDKTTECYKGGITAEDCFDNIESSLLDVKLPSWDEYSKLYEAIRALNTKGIQRQIKSVYLVTTRGNKDFPGTIISAIVSYRDDELDQNLEGPSPADIMTPEELKLVTVTDMAEPSLHNLYDICERRLVQGNLLNQTLEAQGIGKSGIYAQRNFGVVQTLLSNEYNISPEDIQSTKRISDIQPSDLFLKENEIMASPDLISWRYYEMPYYQNEAGEMVVDSFYAVNRRLPKMGLELKYGIDEINFPSFWSERMTFSALWENVKFGVILPTNGWSSLAKDAFSVDRKLTHASFGVSGEMDFPIKIIPKSGVFHLGFGYVFGDPEKSDYKNRHFDVNNYTITNEDNDYLVRFNGQLHYTFAMQIDEDYQFRFGIGGTAYTVERWYYPLVENKETLEKKVEFKKLKQETIGGVSGKVEFMTKNVKTPYGASVQYFDEGLGVNAWLQIPIIQNTFAVRLDVRGNFKAFKDQPRDWENESVFIPMVRFIVNF
jgi:hypothetical protein